MEWFQIFSIIFGVGAIVWWQVSLTNKRIDDTTNGTNKRMDDIKDEINNHIRTDIKEIKKDGQERDRKIEKIQVNIEKLQGDMNKVLAILAKEPLITY